MKSNIFLETDRLIIQKPMTSDIEHLVHLRSIPEVMQYVGNGKIQKREDVQTFLDAAIAYQQKHGFSFGTVFEKHSGKFVGQAGLFHLGFDDNQDEIEIAYRLLPDFWGKGYATELAEALIIWGFTHLKVNKLVALAWPDNIRSQRVLEKADMSHKKLIQLKGMNIFHYDIYKNDAIELIPYDPHWHQMALNEMNFLKTILPMQHVLDIQHVGSTAIPNIKSKPIIDIQIAVDSLNAIKSDAIVALEKFAYHFWADNPDPTRLFFVKGMPPYGEKRTFHVHICEINSKHWINKLKFRDYLLMHPECALQYEQLKIGLAKKYTYNREKYTEGKTKFIENINTTETQP